MKWQNNEHSDVATVNTSGSCRLVRADQRSARSAKARISAVRKRNEATEVEEGAKAVPVIELVQRREAKRRLQPGQAEAESDEANVEVPRLDLPLEIVIRRFARIIHPR